MNFETREQLEAEIDHWLGSWTAFSVPIRTIREAVLGWLDRQAAITSSECIDTRVNFAERIRLYQNGYKDGSRIGSVRLQSELDEYEYKMDALLGRLTNGKWSKTRAYDLDFMESCVDEEYEMINDGELDALREENSKLKAENDALLAAHADDVERLDAMGEGELLKQVDELRAELAKRDKGIERLKARRDELQEEVDELKAELAIANVKLEGKPDCELCDRTTLLTEVESLTAERDRYRELASELLDAAHNMQLIADRGLA